MNFFAFLLIIIALLLVGILVFLQFHTTKPPAGAQLLAHLWKKLPREEHAAKTTQQPSAQTGKPPQATNSSPSQPTNSSR